MKKKRIVLLSTILLMFLFIGGSRESLYPGWIIGGNDRRCACCGGLIIEVNRKYLFDRFHTKLPANSRRS